VTQYFICAACRRNFLRSTFVGIDSYSEKRVLELMLGKQIEERCE
jgi:hypothetical protein